MKNKHKRIKLFESAKCSICGKKFPEGRGAGVHLKRKHEIGYNNSYPHSPTSVMSSTNSDSSNTPRSSRRLRRRSNSLSSTFGEDPSHAHDFSIYNSTNPIEDTPDNVAVRCQSSPINSNQSPTPSDPIPHHPCSLPKDPINSPPQPILLDVDPDDDPDEDSLDSTHSPPRPIITNPHHTSFLQQSLGSLVALNGCTDVISDIPSQPPAPPPEMISSQIPPNSPVSSITSTSQQTHPDPSVALNDSTDSDGECGPNQPSNPILTNPCSTPSSPNSASQNPFIIPPPLSDTFPSLSSNMSSTIINTSSSHANCEPTVALSGYTVGNSDDSIGENTHTGDASNSNNSSNTRVEYRHLKLVDPDCSILGLIFNKCLEEKKIPLSWKQSTTILIYKKGSSDEPSNFRPIALMSCIYKLFTSILSSCISNFAVKEELISNEQKSAKPAEGCHEHSFTLQSVVADCKRNQKNCFFAWLDL